MEKSSKKALIFYLTISREAFSKCGLQILGKFLRSFAGVHKIKNAIFIIILPLSS